MIVFLTFFLLLDLHVAVEVGMGTYGNNAAIRLASDFTC